MPKTGSAPQTSGFDVDPLKPGFDLDAQDRKMFTPQRRDPVTAELVPQGDSVVDLAVRHGWTYDVHGYDDNAGLAVRLFAPDGAILDVRFNQASLRTIKDPYWARSLIDGVAETLPSAGEPYPAAALRRRVERFVVEHGGTK